VQQFQFANSRERNSARHLHDHCVSDFRFRYEEPGGYADGSVARPPT